MFQNFNLFSINRLIKMLSESYRFIGVLTTQNGGYFPPKLKKCRKTGILRCPNFLIRLKKLGILDFYTIFCYKTCSHHEYLPISNKKNDEWTLQSLSGVKTTQNDGKLASALFSRAFFDF